MNNGNWRSELEEKKTLSDDLTKELDNISKGDFAGLDGKELISAIEVNIEGYPQIKTKIKDLFEEGERLSNEIRELEDANMTLEDYEAEIEKLFVEENDSFSHKSIDKILSYAKRSGDEKLLENTYRKLIDLSINNGLYYIAETLSWKISFEYKLKICKKIEERKQKKSLEVEHELTKAEYEDKILALTDKASNMNFYEDFKEGIEIAKKSGDKGIINRTYSRIIQFAFKRCYNTYAGEIAIEAQREDLLKEAIKKLLKSPDFHTDALELAKKYNEELYQETKKMIAEIRGISIDIPTSNEMLKTVYKTKSGTDYQIDNEGYLYRNGEAFETPYGGVFRYGGIVNRKKFLELYDNTVSYGTMRYGMTTMECIYKLLKEYFGANKVNFDEIGNTNSIENKAIVGINEESKMAILTTIIE